MTQQEEYHYIDLELEEMMHKACDYIDLELDSLEHWINRCEECKVFNDKILNRIDSLDTTIFAYNFVKLIPETDVSKFKSRCDMLRKKADNLSRRKD